VPKEQQKRIPAWLLALGRELPPGQIVLPSGTYTLVHIFKHDFFAFTAKYAAESGAVLLKIGRKASLWGLPLGWIGRLHARHEAAAYTALDDLEVVPTFVGRYGRHGIVHQFIEGRPLHKGDPVPDDFFDRLREGLTAIHTRKMAYVDLEKCENVIVGDDGRPYLVDFQIAWRWPWRYGADAWPVRWLRKRLQVSDLYHLHKLQRRVRPDQMSAAALAATYDKPMHVRVWGTLTRPLTLLRRRLLTALGSRRQAGERGAVYRATQGDDATGGAAEE
jgi:hypothetical protein